MSERDRPEITIRVTPELLEAIACEIACYDGDATLIAHCVLECLSREMRPILLIHFSTE